MKQKIYDNHDNITNEETKLLSKVAPLNRNEEKEDEEEADEKENYDQNTTDGMSIALKDIKNKVKIMTEGKAAYINHTYSKRQQNHRRQNYKIRKRRDRNKKFKDYLEENEFDDGKSFKNELEFELYRTKPTFLYSNYRQKNNSITKEKGIRSGNEKSKNYTNHLRKNNQKDGNYDALKNAGWGVITSPNYGGLYPKDTECWYVLVGKEGEEEVEVTFDHFEVDGLPPKYGFLMLMKSLFFKGVFMLAFCKRIIRFIKSYSECTIV